MADGSQKPIAEVVVGDEVVATDPDTGQSGSRPVAQLIRHGGQHTMVDLAFEDGSVLTATEGHPFWDVSTGLFTDAIDLQAGELVLALDGSTLEVTGVRVYGEDLTAYNLEIAGIHTYYAGETPVLVHNSCGLLTNSQATQMAERVGFRPTSSISNGQRVFTDGKRFMTQDVDSHIGGLWKLARKENEFGRQNRMGTYDFDLNWIGP